MKIKINNKEIEIREGETLFEATSRNGFEIPALCYVPGYRHQASCMVCVVKDCNTGLMIPACSTVVVDGMQIDSESEEVIELRRQSLELLLSDHIAVCHPPCNTQQCKLRQFVNSYRAKWNQFTRYSAIKPAAPQHIKEHLWFDVTKCIRCGLCVYNSKDGFTFKGKGFGMQVVLPEESMQHVDASLWGICPTQALYFSEQNFHQD